MKILGYTYEVVEGGNRDEIGAAGRHIGQPTCMIQIASDLSQEIKISTVLHETIEALNYLMELNLEHNIASCLETGLYQALTENGINLRPFLKKIRKIKEK